MVMMSSSITSSRNICAAQLDHLYNLGLLALTFVQDRETRSATQKCRLLGKGERFRDGSGSPDQGGAGSVSLTSQQGCWIEGKRPHHTSLNRWQPQLR